MQGGEGATVRWCVIGAAVGAIGAAVGATVGLVRRGGSAHLFPVLLSS